MQINENNKEKKIAAVPSELESAVRRIWPDGFDWIVYKSRPVYRITPEFCRVISEGAVAAILPLSEGSNSAYAAAAFVESVARKAIIPSVRFDERTLKGPGHAISLIAPVAARSDAVVAFIRREGWEDVVLLYNTEDEFIDLTQIISASNFGRPYRCHLVKLAKDVRPALKHVKNTYGESLIRH
ncbi:hypothetical protein Y032_0077g1148 [Ancylostoma ceylanicum]|uniref:Receptor ligand binding region domain-containing protein n=1 Tax=Ancylostoma ceylanicum TaxID=53326 RepID=A0A016TVA8_9BILA|nr:hypothetical protein Y032_0077g1148 [Ancylostoma ceylanicum]